MRNSLLIIDMQNYFFRTPEKRARYASLIDAINDLIGFLECTPGSFVYHIASVHKRDASTWSRNMKRHHAACLLEGSEDAAIVAELKKKVHHTLLHKTRHSAFMRTELESDLREKGVERIFLSGVYTHGCIALSAVDGWSLDFEVAIAGDCIFSHRPDLADFCLERLRSMFNISILSNREIKEIVGQVPPPP